MSPKTRHKHPYLTSLRLSLLIREMGANLFLPPGGLMRSQKWKMYMQSALTHAGHRGNHQKPLLALLTTILGLELMTEGLSSEVSIPAYSLLAI